MLAISAQRAETFEADRGALENGVKARSVALSLLVMDVGREPMVCDRRQGLVEPDLMSICGGSNPSHTAVHDFLVRNAVSPNLLGRQD